MSALNLLPARLDITVFRGASLRTSGVLMTQDADGQELPLNLIGWTAALRVYRDFTSRLVVHKADTENGQIAITGDAGKINVDIPAAVIAAMGVTSGEFDLFLYGPDGEALPLAAGAFIVADRV